MNTNEVIANVALELLATKRACDIINPNDDVNVAINERFYPTGFRLAHRQLNDLREAVGHR